VLYVFALRLPLDYDLFCLMITESLLRCDGCGQLASPEHIAKRLQRLEWTTRYRPVHIGTLLLSASAPTNDSEFLYAEGGEFLGDAGIILEAAGLSRTGESMEAVLAEFQRGGFFLTYVLDCPFDPSGDQGALRRALDGRLPAVLARIRRSLRPKRLVPMTEALEPFLNVLENANLGCAIVLDDGRPFALDGTSPEPVIARLRRALASVSATNH
jgi:hypothetical protein